MSKDFTDAEKKFLEENFPAGEFMVLSMMVRNDEFQKLRQVLEAAGLNVVLMPGVGPKIDFATDNIKGGSN